jgi:chromosome segregation ATPase
MKMQKEFIEELENRGHANINANKEKITSLDKEVGVYMEENDKTNGEVEKLTEQQQELTDAGKKLVKLNNLRGKISQKVSTITKEHKFFTENTVCPTCTQSIEEEFRLNRISDAQNKAKELKEGYEELENTIKFEQERERQFTALSQEITNLTHGISQNNTRISLNQRQIRDLEHEIQTFTENLANRNSEHEKLEEFRENLQKTRFCLFLT